MKNLTMLCLSILILTTISCKKEKPNVQQSKQSIARNWIWNGEKSGGQGSYSYKDTLMPIYLESEKQVVFMGKKFTLTDDNGQRLSYSADNNYDVDNLTYYYNNDSVLYMYRESAIKSSVTIILSAKKTIQ